MKIIMLSTPWIPVPPRGYGGTELVVANLAEGLLKKGHEVTVFATGDSVTSARLEYYYPKALGNNFFLKQHPSHYLFHIHAFLKYVQNERFDIIHSHAGPTPLFFLDLQSTPFIHTLHGPYYHNLSAQSEAVQEKREILLKFEHHPFISISDNQRIGIPQLRYVKTVYNGIKVQEFPYFGGKGDYLAWLGRITPNKGLDVTIQVGKTLDIPLKIAGFIDKGDEEYFQKTIRPQFDDKTEFVGELNNREEKVKFLGGALATIFPVRWHEPFGLVMIESMACGTPVVAFSKGSIPEVVKDGETGYIVNESSQEVYGDWIVKKNGMSGLAEAIEKLLHMPQDQYLQMRKFSRQHVEKHFTVERMVEGYEEAYKEVLQNQPNKYHNRANNSK